MEDLGNQTKTATTSRSRKQGETAATTTTISVESAFLNGLIDLLLRNNFPIKASENRLDKIQALDPISVED